MRFPTYHQIREITANIITDTNPEAFTAQELTEATEAIAAQISRWDLDTNPAPGTIAHHILNTLAGRDTPTHLTELATDEIHVESLTAALDNLLVAKYVEAHANGYSISPRGLRALGDAPLGD